MNTTTYQALVIRKALELYANHGIKANSHYTPKNMMAAATRITGKDFKPRDYTGAIAALTAHVEADNVLR